MLRNCQKFRNRTFGFVHHDTIGQNHGPVWKTQSFLLIKICTVILWQDCLGKGKLRKSYWSTLGEGFQLGLFIRTQGKKIILICVCGWDFGWKKTKHLIDVESTEKRSRFGRTNIFPWSFISGIHSKTNWNKQRYCGQLQSHVWIAKFPRRELKNIHTPRIFVFLRGPMIWKVTQRNA